MTNSKDWNTDNSTLSGSLRLAETIRDYWLNKGFNVVKVSVEAIPQMLSGFTKTIYTIKSNLVNGLPPRSSN